jgi:signal transduction histidine kinase
MESIGRDGDVTLSAGEDQAVLNGNLQGVAVLKVADTGKGISPEARERLFDPFFTTKEGGTGLGLSIASRIVNRLGGELQFETELNRGTTFMVLLPRVTDHETENSAGRG